MDRPKLRSAALVAALTTIAATAWATSDRVSNAAYVPAPVANGQQPAWQPPAQPVAVSDTLAPNESVVAESDATYAAPVEDHSIAQPRITIEGRRLTRDQRIQSDVMDKLGENGRISGQIGVETRDAMVTLTGYTSTSGQAERAGRAARSVMGVRYVDNQIRPRVGGSV